MMVIPVHPLALFGQLGEGEVVFGFWALVLVLGMAFAEGSAQSVHYLESRNYTEPLFVFAIMVVAASKPILHCATSVVNEIGKSTRLNSSHTDISRMPSSA